jgi:predicted AAA+ superfamily ATPase
MILKDTLREIVQRQKEELGRQELGVPRELLNSPDSKSSHAAIISGIRRCGKSTLLRQLMKKLNNFYYFNFEDQRLIGFEVSDFEKLDAAFKELYGESKYYFFDEIQNIPGWERFVRKMQDSGKKFFITGSNASLLSRELGTKLTGRHMLYELFPFSFAEMLKLRKKKPSLDSFKDYLNQGGFPEYLKYGDDAMLQQVFKDILNRDIVVRHGLRNSKLVEQLALYLLANSGKEFSHNKLRKMFDAGSTNTMTSYVSFFEDSYIIFTIPKFDYSYKKQLVNAKKVYAIDTGLARVNSVSFSEDNGRMLENAVFLHLRRKHKDIYYFREKKECDFLVKEKGKITGALQVCYELTEDNKEREMAGLKEAMERFNLKTGIILTLKQKDDFGSIKVIPAWEWMLNKF